ncbi:MAG: DUF1697 domain-containing protein [Ignavibacteria bacterium]|nr:DUF1697 domain-containing protein [Ignavibacteria bacterium]
MQKTYITFLRGINVSGHKIIKMDELRILFDGLGFRKTETYKQSGNVLFNYRETETSILEKKISDAILHKFNFEVPAIVINAEDLRQIIPDNPFTEDKSKDSSFFHVTFLQVNPDKRHVNKISEMSFHPDEFYLKNKTVYLYIPGGYGKTKLSNSFIENKLKVKATTRNWKTLNAMLDMADKIQGK